MKKEKNTSPILKTPQSLIHIKHNMSILQYKYWVVLLHHIKDQVTQGVEPDKHGYHYISFNEITDFLGYTPKKSEVYRDLKQLRSYAVEYNVLEKDGEKAKVVEGFLRAASVSSKRIGYVLPPIFIEAILGLDGSKNIFQLLNWEIFNSFNGKYEAIIYKLCKDYIGVGRTPYMTIEEYREYLGLKENEYSQFFRLNEKTIKKPILTINKSELSDISIKTEFKKQGRNVIGLWFLIESKSQQSFKFPELEPNPAFMFSKINIPLERQTKYLEQYQEDQIQAIITRANDYANDVKAKGKKLNLDGIYKKAFTEGWGLENLEAQKIAEGEEKKKAQRLAKIEAEKKKKKELEVADIEAQKKSVLDDFAKLSEKEKDAKINEVIENSIDMFKKIFISDYKKYKMDILAQNPMFFAEYVRYFERKK